MKKAMLILVALCATILCVAAPRMEISKGVNVTAYGCSAVFEKSSYSTVVPFIVTKSGSYYNIVCGNRVAKKSISKSSLKQAIEYVIKNDSTLRNWVSKDDITYVVDYIYNSVDDYYRRL